MKALSLIIVIFCFGSPLLAVESNTQDPQLLQSLTALRQRQEGEENGPVRIVQQPITTRVEQSCTLSEQSRQRLRDLGARQKHLLGNINIDAGHGEVRIDGNSGTINNSVNVQVVNTNDRKCY